MVEQLPRRLFLARRRQTPSRLCLTSRGGGTPTAARRAHHRPRCSRRGTRALAGAVGPWGRPFGAVAAALPSGWRDFSAADEHRGARGGAAAADGRHGSGASVPLRRVARRADGAGPGGRGKRRPRGVWCGVQQPLATKARGSNSAGSPRTAPPRRRFRLGFRALRRRSAPPCGVVRGFKAPPRAAGRAGGPRAWCGGRAGRRGAPRARAGGRGGSFFCFFSLAHTPPFPIFVCTTAEPPRWTPRLVRRARYAAGACGRPQ
jgi:hypothetical protein